MTDDDKALVERLRNDIEYVATHIASTGTTQQRFTNKRSEQAADRIEALSAENERLRDALENIVNNCGECSGYGTYPAEDTATGKVLWRDCPSPQCHSARVALGETE